MGSASKSRDISRVDTEADFSYQNTKSLKFPIIRTRTAEMLVHSFRFGTSAGFEINCRCLFFTITPEMCELFWEQNFI